MTSLFSSSFLFVSFFSLPISSSIDFVFYSTISAYILSLSDVVLSSIFFEYVSAKV